MLTGPKLVVAGYLQALSDLQRYANDSNWTRIYDFEDKALVMQGMRVMWALMRDARLFVIPAQLLVAFGYSAMKEVERQIGSKDSSGGGTNIQLSSGSIWVNSQRLLKMANRTQMPERMPFDVCYLGIDEPIDVTETQRDFGMDPTHFDSVVKLTGLLIYRQEGQAGVVLFLEAQSEVGAGPQILPAPIYGPFLLPSNDPRLSYGPEDKWRAIPTFFWAITPLVVDWLVSHQTLINEKTKSYSYRSFYRKEAKRSGLRPLPPPYYVVTICDETIEQAYEVKLPRPRPECQHQFDIRGHLKLRTMRGPLPLDEKLERRLRRDKRRLIFTIGQPPGYVCEALARRGKPQKQRDEWMSVLPFWRKPGRGGSPGGPYIPAIRRSARAVEYELAVLAKKGKDA